MTKKISTFLILGIILIGVLSPVVTFGQSTLPSASGTCIIGSGEYQFTKNGVGVSECSAAGGVWNQTANTQTQQNTTTGKNGQEEEGNSGLANWIIKQLFRSIGYLLISISSLALLLGGLIFDSIVQFTIVDMSKNLGDVYGIGNAIKGAWAVLRDIANMCFIFVLLFAAFKAMFQADFGNFWGKTVRDIIIVALLINFSLFFSKVVIDASNVVSVGFYKSITNNSVTYKTSSFEKTISAGYMNMLGLQTFFGSNILTNGTLKTPSQILVVGIMTAVVMLIVAVILLIASVMFAARFVILIFLMILSPLALIAYIIPGQKKQFDDWIDALKNQSFFAPLYFALTWVVFKVGSSLIGILGKSGLTNNTSLNQWADIAANPKGVMPLIINYVLIIGLTIAALIISKTMASKTPGFKAISGGIGTAALGTTALVGRNTFGRGAKWISENKREEWSKTSAGRAGLWLANKGRQGSFDVRSIDSINKVPGLGDEMKILGKAGGKGGFAKSVEEKAKAKAAYAKDVYGKTDAEKEREVELEKDYNEAKTKDEQNVRDRRKENADKAKKVADENERKRSEYADTKLSPHKENLENARKEQAEKERKLEEERRNRGSNSAQVFALEKEVEAAKEKVKRQQENLKTVETELENTDEAYKELKTISNESKQELKTALDRIKKPIDESEYSEGVRDIGTELNRVKSAAANRQEEYAKRLESTTAQRIVGAALGAATGGIFGLGTATLGGIVGEKIANKAGTLQGNKAAARSVRKGIKGKTLEEEAADLLKKMEKEKNKAQGKDENTDEGGKEKQEGGEENKK